MVEVPAFLPEAGERTNGLQEQSVTVNATHRLRPLRPTLLLVLVVGLLLLVIIEPDQRAQPRLVATIWVLFPPAKCRIPSSSTCLKELLLPFLPFQRRIVLPSLYQSMLCRRCRIMQRCMCHPTSPIVVPMRPRSRVCLPPPLARLDLLPLAVKTRG